MFDLTSLKARTRTRVVAWLRRNAPNLAAWLARRLAASRHRRAIAAIRREQRKCRTGGNYRWRPLGLPHTYRARYTFRIESGVETERARQPSQVIDVRPAQSYRRTAPVFVNVERLDPDRRQWFRHLLSAPCAVPAASIAAVGPAIMFGHGYVARPDGALLFESLSNTSPVEPRSNYGLERDADNAVWTGAAIETDEIVFGPATTLRNLGEFVWGHWLFELLPRVDILRAHPQFARTKFVVRRSRFPTTREALLACGVAPENVIELDHDRPVGFENYLCVSPVLRNQAWIAPQNVAFIREAGLRFRAASVDGSAAGNPRSIRRRRLFVTRNDAKYRRLLNQDAVAELLRSAGFEAVTIGDMGFARQVELFEQAEAVIAVLGSGASNIVFSPPGTPIMLLAPNRDYPFFFMDVASIAGHLLAVVFGESVQRQHSPFDDFRVEPDDVRAGLAALRLGE